MPRPGRWCHISQDLNHDPEFERLCEEFGLGGVRFFIQAMAILDKTENHWRVPEDFNPSLLARSCGTKTNIILGSVRLLIDMKWISVGVDSEQNHFIFARNYMKYRGNRAHENELTKQGSTSSPFLTFPFLNTHTRKKGKFAPVLDSKLPEDGIGVEAGNHTPDTSKPETEKGVCDPKKEKKALKKKENHSPPEHFVSFWDSFPLRDGKKVGKVDTEKLFSELSTDDRLLAVQAARNFAASQRVQKGLGIMDPQRFLKNGKGSEPWREWIEPEISQNGKGEPNPCASRIEVEGNLQTCKRPSTKRVGKSFICDECYELYQKKQGSLKQKGELRAN